MWGEEAPRGLVGQSLTERHEASGGRAGRGDREQPPMHRGSRSNFNHHRLAIPNIRDCGAKGPDPDAVHAGEPAAEEDPSVTELIDKLRS